MPAGTRTRSSSSAASPRSARYPRTAAPRLREPTSPRYAGPAATACSIASSSPWPWVATTTIDLWLASAAVKSGQSSRSARQPSPRARPASACAMGERPTTTRCGAGSTGSMYTSSAPSLWQEIGTTVIPSGMAPPNLSVVPSSSSRAVPSAMTCWAWLITDGSAHAPPIHPCTCPDAVMIARAPTWPDDGPWRQTTVASATGSPRSASAAACSTTCQLSIVGCLLIVGAHRRRARDVVAVRDRLPDPVGQQRHVDVAHTRIGDRVEHGVDERGGPADRGAFADALGADRVVRARRDHLAVQFEAGRLPRGRQQVVHVVRADAVAVRVERDELHVRHRVRLGQAPHDLPFDDHRVDPYTTVVDGDHVEHVPDAGLRVDLNRDEVDGERPGQVRRVVVRGVLQAGLHAVRHVAVRGQRALLDGHAAVGRAAHVEPAELPLDVFLGHLEQVSSQLARLGADLAGHHRHRRARDRGTAGRVGAHAERRGVGVALLDDHVLGGQAQLLRDDLRPRGLVALALAPRAGPQDRLAGHVDLQLGGVEHLDPEDVVLAAVARAEWLGHRRDAQPEQLAPLARSEEHTSELQSQSNL